MWFHLETMIFLRFNVVQLGNHVLFRFNVVQLGNHDSF